MLFITYSFTGKKMSISLEGKVALVTGGARGIGAAMASAFAVAGAKVMISDILEDAGIRHNVADEAAWEAAITATIARFGGLTTVVNNAGIETSATIAEVSVEQIERLLSVNVRGLVLGMKHAMRAMRPGGAAGQGGSILNLSSLSQLRAGAGTGVYAATKAAVDRLTKVGAVEGGVSGWNIRVNCLYPGFIQTDMFDHLLEQRVQMGLAKDLEQLQSRLAGGTPLKRLGTVEDVANAAVFLSSDMASFITGIGLSVDGGMAIV
jgi:NAD(P)-dependent dehydrogenase (short-subunit alcohol dehydrogenase family)